MSVSPSPPLEAILQQCADVAPAPWYPSAFAQRAGVPRDALDEPLNLLRMNGLLELTDWVPGTGQGYRITSEGREALAQPRRLARLRAGPVVPVRGPADDAPGWGRRPANAWEQGQEVLDRLRRPMVPRATQVLLAVNVLVFVAGVAVASQMGKPLGHFIVASDSDILLQTGAVQGGPLLQGQWWRLLSSCFVHIGLIHLAMNMYSLWMIGPLVERLWGRWRYVVLYLTAGLGGSCAAMLDDPRALVAGASGAIASPGSGRQPLIRVWDASLPTATLETQFAAYSDGLTTGLSVSAGDTRGQGYANIVTVSLAGRTPAVRIFDGRTARLTTEFGGFPDGLLGGLTVAVGDTRGTGRADIAVGRGPGDGPAVRVFDGLNFGLREKLAGYPIAPGGLTVAVHDLLGLGYADLLVGAGPGQSPGVRAFDGSSFVLFRDYVPFNLGFLGGLFLG